MRNQRPQLVLRKRKLVDLIALALALGLVLGISVFGFQEHASHEQLAKAAATGR
jgi:hypothetical protein